MSDRCEPPEHLRGVDGWHVLASPSPHGYERPWFWVPPSDGGQARWNDLGCPAQAFCNGYRYLAPVATPAEVEALRARVERQSRIMATLLQHATSAPLTDDDMAWARAQVAALEDRT